MVKKGYIKSHKEKDTANSTIKFVWHIYYITFFANCKYIGQNFINFPYTLTYFPKYAIIP